MTEFNFTMGNYPDDLAQLASLMGSYESDHHICFEGMLARGSASIVELDEGLHIRTWDFSVPDDTIFHMEAVPPGSPIYFSVHYFLTPDVFRINAGGIGKAYDYEIKSNILFSSNQSHFAYSIKKLVNARSLDICFSEEWLRLQFPENKKLVELLLSLQVPGINCFLEPFTIKDYELCRELSSLLSEGQSNGISIRARVFQLLDDFMATVFDGLEDKPRLPFSQQQVTIWEVARYTESLLTEKLPHLHDIATRFSMSPSTLKRHFKAVTGKNIYEYYLGKKMELAVYMLKHEKLSVTSVAYKLGYEKVNSFSKIFKEHFGKGPKDFSLMPD